MSETLAYYARAYVRPEAAPPTHRTAFSDISMTWAARVAETDAQQTMAADKSGTNLAAAVDRERAPRQHFAAFQR
jgi:hypothetical protein